MHGICLLLALWAVPDTSLIGTLRITGPAQSRAVVLAVEGKSETALAGDLLNELGHLGSAKVELLGHMEGATLRVEGYRILDVGSGAKPLVGVLVLLPGGTALALADGEGDPVPLSLNASGQERLQPQVGAKIWVFGKKLLSGELRVARYGILKESVGSKVAPQPNGEQK